jgi:hypothetical protein
LAGDRKIQCICDDLKIHLKITTDELAEAEKEREKGVGK